MTAQTPKCNDVIVACDKVIADKNEALRLSDLAIITCKQHAGDLTTEVEQLRDENNSIFHNPWIVGILSLSVGVVLAKTVIFK